VFTTFGEKDLPAEKVAGLLAREVSAYLNSNAPVGPHLADQLALPMALAVHASGEPGAYVVSEMSEHTWTNLDVIKRFLPLKVEVAEQASSRDGWLIRLAPGPCQSP
jgi:RNA 3'-terminal phosphate cyclase (ATP)